MATININLGIAAVAGGTVDALTITLTPAVVPYNLMPVFFRSSGPNLTTTPTANVNASVARVITKKGGEALVAGDIDGDHIIMLDVANNRWELLNPASDSDTTFWQAGAGVNSLMDKRSTTGSGDDGFTAGKNAVNSATEGQAVGFDSNNSGVGGQAIGAGAINSAQTGQALGANCDNSGQEGQAIGNAQNSGDNGQAIGHGANNSGIGGQAIGDDALNSGESGQAIGAGAVNEFLRSTALGYLSVTTDDDQMNLAQTLRLQAYTGASARNLTIGTDGVVSASTGIVRELWIPAASMTPRATNGAAASSEEYATNDINLDYFLFDGATEEAVQFTLSLPQAWNAGTVKVKLYWDAATGASAVDGVVWGVRAGSLANDDAIDAALGTEVEVTDAVIAVGDMHVTAATGAITIGGSPAVDDFLIFQVARKVGNASDNMTEDAKLLGIKLQYTESANLPAAW